MRSVGQHLKYVVGRLNYGRIRLQPSGYRNFSEQKLRETGEPFLLMHRQDDRLVNVPLVRLFGPGRFWRVKSSLVDLAIVGEGSDAWVDVKEMNHVLSQRRHGLISGIWFSRPMPDGEDGVRHLDEVDLITSEEFRRSIIAFREGNEP